MCGVTGILSAGGGIDGHVLDDMVDALTHRGPDDRGTWVDESAGIGLGHRRLSIRDLSTAGHQPMASTSGRWVLAYNGEVYNAAELRRDLEAVGIRFRGHSDTEVLLEGIDRWGVRSTVQRCTGMFAFAVWDRQNRELTLVRDRTGIKPLYWGVTGSGTVVFGSELKALRQHHHFDNSVDPTAVARYLRCSYVPGPGAIWKSCWKVMPGTMQSLHFQNGQLAQSTERYWSLLDHVRTSSEVFDEQEALDELRRRLQDAIRQRLVSDVPLGVLLSGGVDSSLVAAIAAEQASGTIRTFSAGFEDSRLDESAHAARVAASIGTDHSELIVTERDAVDLVPQLSTMYDEPFGDSSQIPTHLVCKLARSQVTVALSGDGGDETFGGYFIYNRLAQMANGAGRLPSFLRKAVGASVSLTPGPVLNAIAGSMRACTFGRVDLDAGRLQTAARLLAMSGLDGAHAYTMSSRIDLTRAMQDPPSFDCSIEEAASKLAGSNPVDRAMFADSMTYLVDDILTKVDRASMACSLEVRVPLLDHHVLEHAWATPVSWRRRGGVGKWPLRQMLASYVPSHLWDRPKQGFGAPIHRWLRCELRDWGNSLITGPWPEQVGLHRRYCERLWSAVQRGDRRGVRPVWTLLMLLSWIKAETRR